ncbi:hypothetical protein EDB84DRAFT_1439212 [Lactarius hengduanensis]|nr:hypothetical protein EDB84DRAFT_1439212 [Lactarius hengduanensis]
MQSLFNILITLRGSDLMEIQPTSADLDAEYYALRIFDNIIRFDHIRAGSQKIRQTVHAPPHLPVIAYDPKWLKSRETLYVRHVLCPKEDPYRFDHPPDVIIQNQARNSRCQDEGGIRCSGRTQHPHVYLQISEVLKHASHMSTQTGFFRFFLDWVVDDKYSLCEDLRSSWSTSNTNWAYFDQDFDEIRWGKASTVQYQVRYYDPSARLERTHT